MTWGGWISMCSSLFIVISLVTWCFYKLFTTRDANDDEDEIDVITKNNKKEA